MSSIEEILAAVNDGQRDGRSPAGVLCLACAQELDLAGAAMALMNNDGQQAVVGASSPLVARLEDLQFDLGEGPGVDASRSHRPVLCNDLDDVALARWPAFGRVARDAGIGAILALPLQVGAVRLGSLGLYHSAPGGVDSKENATAGAYAEAAVVVLLDLQAQMLPNGGLHPDLGAPLELRTEVHQATGFLSVTASVGLAEALLLLRARAYSSGQPLLEVARDVLAGRLRIRTDSSEDE